MGKKLGLIAIAALLLTGCASTEEPQVVETVTVTATPSAAATQAGVKGTAGHEDAAEAAYLEAIKAKWRGNPVPSDAELIAYGHSVCESLMAGVAPTSVVPGDTTTDMSNNVSITSTGRRTLCPEANP